MSEPAGLDWSGPFIQASINYIDPRAPDPGGINDGEREKSTLSLISHRMAIQDVRARAADLSLERNGFVWRLRPTAVRDFSDPAQVSGAYVEEAVEIVTDLTGAEKVLVFGQVFRDGSRPPGAHAPVYNAHVDYNADTIRAVAARLLPADEREDWLARRILLVNLWRPMSPVESSPLALCDATSVSARDLVHGPIGGKSAAGVPSAAGYNLAHNPAHRWCYVSNMQPEEVLVFKLCDTDPDRVQWTAHTAFDDPTSPGNAAPRRSIELRTLAFLPT